MSALQASRKYGVPSRTLYDKVKKMGITTGRQVQRKSLPNYPAQFPGLSGVSFKFSSFSLVSKPLFQTLSSRVRDSTPCLPDTCKVDIPEIVRKIISIKDNPFYKKGSQFSNP